MRGQVSTIDKPAVSVECWDLTPTLSSRPSEWGMMEKLNTNDRGAYIPFFGVCLLAIVFIMFSALTNRPKDVQAASPEALSKRTLREYYSRRQYLGSPPEIPHPASVHGKDIECLLCHADGGWTRTLKRKTPVTTHPERISCTQCHVSPAASSLFRETDWRSLPPSPLGRSYLPSSPPPIPHDLQMRKKCIVCHEGPGVIEAIRMKHSYEGLCNQCHVPDPPVQPFRR